MASINILKFDPPIFEEVVSMSFLSPLSLLLGLLAVPILILYMLKLRRREVDVSSTLLWQLLMRDREANAPWQRLKRNLLLFLQLLILAALVLALARPFIPVPSVVAGSVVALLDASASMQATDVQPSRFEAAKAQARQIADDLSGGAEMTLILVGQQPQVLAAGESDPAALRRAIESAQPTNGEADWGAAFALAAGAVGGADAERATVAIVSDGGLPGELPALPGEVRYLPIGESGDNLAISALSLRPASGGPELFASVSNHGKVERSVILSFSTGGQLFNAQQLAVPAGGSTPVVLSDLPDAQTIYEARLSLPSQTETGNGLDSLAADDVAFAVYQPPTSGRALLVSPGNIFLEQVLSVLPGLQPFRAPPDQPLPSDPFDLYIFDGALPAELPLEDLLIVNPPANGLFNVGRVFADTGNVTLADSPLTRFLDWDEVHVLQAKEVEPPFWSEVVIRAEGGPLVFAGEQGGRRIAVITFDLHDSDLPLQIAFPILFSNLINYLAPARAFSVPEGLQPGETLAIRPETSVTHVAIAKPGGDVFPAVPEGVIVFGETQEPGVYAVNYFNADRLLGTDYFAVNLFDPRESDIEPAPSIMVGRSTIPAAEREEIGQREFWPWLAGAALLVLMVEWWVYQRGSALVTARAKVFRI